MCFQVYFIWGAFQKCTFGKERAIGNLSAQLFVKSCVMCDSEILIVVEGIKLYWCFPLISYLSYLLCAWLPIFLLSSLLVLGLILCLQTYSGIHVWILQEQAHCPLWYTNPAGVVPIEPVFSSSLLFIAISWWIYEHLINSLKLFCLVKGCSHIFLVRVI